MKYAYYPGCSLHESAASYDKSVKAVCKKLGIDLWEIPDWTCCGASSAHSFDHLMGIALPAKTLVPAEQEGLDIVAPCAACWQRLVWVNHEINKNDALKEKVGKAIGQEIKGTSKVLSIMELLATTGLDKITQAVKKPLKGLKLASYYGCFYVKPPKVAHVDDPENPMIMDNIIEALGGEPVKWPYKTECCGASLGFIDEMTTVAMTKKVLDMAVKSGADAVVTACPVCELNLDLRQPYINKKYGSNLNIPVYYLSQLMAFTMGATGDEIGLKKNYTEAQSMLAKLG